MLKGNYIGLNKGLLNGLQNISSKGLLTGENNISADRLNGFNPEDFGNMYGWWKADRTDSMVLSSGVSIEPNPYYCSRWNSVIPTTAGNSIYFFRQLTNSQRPLLRSDESGNNYLYFQTTGGIWLTNDSTQIQKPCVFIIVSKCREIDSSNRYLLGSRAATAESNIRHFNTVGKRVLATAGSSIASLVEKESSRENQLSVNCLSITSDDPHFRVNLNKKTAITYNATAPNGYNLNSRFTGPSQPGNNNIYEILVYKQSLNEDSYTRIFNYLRTKYKIQL